MRGLYLLFFLLIGSTQANFSKNCYFLCGQKDLARELIEFFFEGKSIVYWLREEFNYFNFYRRANTHDLKPNSIFYFQELAQAQIERNYIEQFNNDTFVYIIYLCDTKDNQLEQPNIIQLDVASRNLVELKGAFARILLAYPYSIFNLNPFSEKPNRGDKDERPKTIQFNSFF